MYNLKEFKNVELDITSDDKYNYLFCDKNHQYTLILLPGSFSNQYVWEETLANLDLDLNVMIINNPGHENYYSPSPNGSIEYFVELVLKAIEHACIDKFFVSGHSIGAMMSIEMLKYYNNTDQLQGAIPLEGWTHYTVSEKAFQRLKNETLTKEQIRKRTYCSNKSTKNWTVEDKSIFAQIWRRWNGYDILEKSSIPILEIWGDRGLNVKPTKEMLMIPDNENIEIVWLRNGGHSLLVQFPELIGKNISNFIEKYI